MAQPMFQWQSKSGDYVSVVVHGDDATLTAIQRDGDPAGSYSATITAKAWEIERLLTSMAAFIHELAHTQGERT